MGGLAEFRVGSPKDREAIVALTAHLAEKKLRAASLGECELSTGMDRPNMIEGKSGLGHFQEILAVLLVEAETKCLVDRKFCDLHAPQ